MANSEPYVEPKGEPYVEPWLRGTHTNLHPVMAALLHSFEHAREDIVKWTEGLTPDQLWAEPAGLGSVAFHVRHLAASAERLLTYATGQQLSEEQLAELKREKERGSEDVLQLFDEKLQRAEAILTALDPSQLNETRYLGRKRIPVSMTALVVHTAEHTQRHVGEAIVTAKVVRGMAR